MIVSLIKKPALPFTSLVLLEFVDIIGTFNAIASINTFGNPSKLEVRTLN